MLHAVLFLNLQLLCNQTLIEQGNVLHCPRVAEQGNVLNYPNLAVGIDFGLFVGPKSESVSIQCSIH